MSKKEYRLVASIMCKARQGLLDISMPDKLFAWDSIVSLLGHGFKADNPKFDFFRFYDACRGKENGKL